MTTRRCRLVLAILQRFVSDGDALTGDLLEEVSTRRSHLWLCRQAVTALWLEAGRRHRLEIRPLRLVEGDVARGAGLVHAPVRPINLSASPTGSGVGGLGIVALATLVTIVNPQIWWAVVVALLGGVLLGAAMVWASAREVRSRSGHARPPVLLPRA
jgi:hypothetical protein